MSDELIDQAREVLYRINLLAQQTAAAAEHAQKHAEAIAQEHAEVVALRVARRGYRYAFFAALAVSVLVSLVAAIGYVTQGAHLSALVRCQGAFNETTVHALQLRSTSAQLERDAQRELLTTTATTPEQKRAAIGRYLAALQRADAQRDAAPLPATNTCR